MVAIAPFDHICKSGFQVKTCQQTCDDKPCKSKEYKISALGFPVRNQSDDKEQECDHRNGIPKWGTVIPIFSIQHSKGTRWGLS